MFNRIANTCVVMFTGAIVGSVAIVAPAIASSRPHSPAQSVASAVRAYGAGSIGQGIQGTAVYSRGRDVGRDPDPSIRGQLLRDDFRDRSM
jgi:hypothetical protein